MNLKRKKYEYIKNVNLETSWHLKNYHQVLESYITKKERAWHQLSGEILQCIFRRYKFCCKSKLYDRNETDNQFKCKKKKQ